MTIKMQVIYQIKLTEKLKIANNNTNSNNSSSIKLMVFKMKNINSLRVKTHPIIIQLAVLFNESDQAFFFAMGYMTQSNHSFD